MSAGAGYSRVRVAAIIVLATLAATLPMHLLGTLAPFLMEELRFDATLLGVAVGGLQAVRALTAFPLGRLVDRRGSVESLRIACLLTLASMMGLVLVATSFATMLPWLALAALAHALHQPAANRLLLGVVRSGRLGLAFGFKQSIPPLSAMLAGLSVPLLVSFAGWRAPFVLVAVIALILPLATTSLEPRDAHDRRGSGQGPRVALPDRRLILLLSLGFGLALFASSNLLAFYVTAEVDAGRDAEAAGYHLAVVSAMVIVIRILLGAACDHTEVAPLRLCAGFLASGTVGYALLATGGPVLSPAGLLVALCGSWGAPAVFWLGLMRAYPSFPGRITGAMAPGVLGGVLGPVLFGISLEYGGYAIGWILTGIAVLAASLVIEAAHRRLESQGGVARTG